MNVLSLFDGISCGRVALERARRPVKKYYASEIDKYVIQVSQKNYPDTIQLGDVTKWRDWDIDWSSIDLLIGGSPCQGFSNAGKGLNFDDPRSALFFVFVDILNHIKSVNPNVKFLLENVKMKKDWIDIITQYMGVKPVLINSALVSAQQRNRLYWTDIAEISQPKDRHIYLKDILLNGGIGCDVKNQGKEITKVNTKKPQTLLARDYKGFGNQTMSGVFEPLCVNSQSGDRYGKRKQPSLSDRVYSIDGKNPALTASYQTKIATPIKYLNDKNLQHLMRDFGSKGKILCDKDEKTNTLTASMGMRGGNGIYYAEQKSGKNVFEVKDKKIVIYNKEYKMDLEDGFWCFRKLTPIECERLQTLPDNYTEGISNSQRYKALGNGWTVDVIAHIFSFLPQSDQN